jgi:hypothetical protein
MMMMMMGLMLSKGSSSDRGGGGSSDGGGTNGGPLEIIPGNNNNPGLIGWSCIRKFLWLVMATLSLIFLLRSEGAANNTMRSNLQKQSAAASVTKQQQHHGQQSDDDLHDDNDDDDDKRPYFLMHVGLQKTGTSFLLPRSNSRFFSLSCTFCTHYCSGSKKYRSLGGSRVVVVYRQFYEWLPSWHNMFYKVSSGKTFKGEEITWDFPKNGQASGLHFDLDNRVGTSDFVHDMELLQQHPAQMVRNKFAEFFSDVTIMNLQQQQQQDSGKLSTSMSIRRKTGSTFATIING